jgi:hypothetical protein
MGSLLSTRWNAHSRNYWIEECKKVSIKAISPHLKPGYLGLALVLIGINREIIFRYRVLGDFTPSGIEFLITVTSRGQDRSDIQSLVNLSTTKLPWGKNRYWFICPKEGCGRRVESLYILPGGMVLACRRCHHLNYESQYESSMVRKVYAEMAMDAQAEFPGVTIKEIRAMWERDDEGIPHRFWEESDDEFWEGYDRHEGYLSEQELSESSGLSREDISRLNSIRLLVPDTKDGRYRPKLVGWAKKLDYLLEAGWGPEEIQRWSKNRWQTKDPRKWPPDRSHDY